MSFTAESLGYVNLIVVVVDGNFDVYALTNYFYEYGKLKEKVGWIQAYFLGRYTKYELPKTIYEKLQLGD